MKAKEVLKLLKVTRPTLCKYVKIGKIRAKKINDRVLDYNEDDVFTLAGIENRKKCVLYVRVSTQKQKSSLDTQIQTLTQYANANGVQVDKVYKDIASGLSFDRGEFQSLLLDVIQYKVKEVYVTDKDRFSRISFNMWKELFSYFNCNIIVLNDIKEKSDNEEKEIFSDIISLIHCFAMKMYSKRRKNKLKLIEENLEAEQ